MAITTMDGMIAGFQPPTHFYKMHEANNNSYNDDMMSLLYFRGTPGLAVEPAPGSIAGAALTSYAGQIPWTNPGAGNSYLARFEAWGPAYSTLFLCDRLWHNDSITATQTTDQTINSATLPARDRTGTTDGVDVMAGIEVYTACTNGSAVTNTTITYTNSAGTGSRTGTIPSTANQGGGFPANSPQGIFVPFCLAAGDVGVRSIQTLHLGTSYGTGSIHLVMYRILAVAHLGLDTVQGGNDCDFTKTQFLRLYDNTVPFLLTLSGSMNTSQYYGSMTVAQG